MRALSELLNVKLIALTLLTAVSVGAAQTLDGWASSEFLTAGDSLRLRCSATGPSGLALRLACPLLAGAWSATCFEDCRLPISAAAMPELTAASCELKRRLVAAPHSLAWEEVTIEYEFSNVSQRHQGNYTCQFMLLRTVSVVKVAPAATAASTSATTVAAADVRRTTTEPFRMNPALVGAAGRDEGLATTVTVNGDSVTMAATTVAPVASPGDWFRIEIYGPITLGHVIAVALTAATVLLTACLTAGLVSCYCRRRRQKRRSTQLRNSVDGTAGWASSLSHGRQPPIGGFSTANIATAASTTATLVGAEASWTSSPIYADVESSPLISGGGRERQQNAFGSQGGGINGGDEGRSNGASFFTHDQLGRHSFHSVRQHQLINRGTTAASAAASPTVSRPYPHPHNHQHPHPYPYPHSPPFSSSSSEAVSVSILQLVAEQRAEIDRLSQQLRSSQRQLDRLATSHTDLHRCLSSRQLSSARVRQESSPQRAGEDQDQGQCHSVAGGVYGSTDALTVETIDEEFEADGTLKTPARRQLQLHSHPVP